MAYKIGFLAKLFNLAPQTIHYYESMGLLKPKRDKENAYRSYGEDSIQRMGTIVKLRNAQFSLKETTAAYEGNNSCRSILTSYQQQRNVMQKKVEEDLAVVGRLDEYIDILSAFLIEGEGNWKVVERAGYCHRCFKDQYPSEEEAEQASQWYENLFWTEAGMTLEEDKCVYSMDTSMEQYRKRITEQTQNIQVTEAGLFAVCMLECVGQGDYARIMKLKDAFFDAHPEYMLRSFPFARSIVVFHEEGQMHMILELLCPIKNL